MRETLAASQFTHAFVVGTFQLIDVQHPNTGKSAYSGQSLEEIQQRYPGAQIVELEPWVAAKEQAQITPTAEIGYDQYIDMLEVLPPQRWRFGVDRTTESFELCEHTS